LNQILTTGELSTRVPVAKSPQALDQLVVLFNRLMDQNQQLIARMHESLDAVSHDLRTPMARLRASAEMALQAEANPQIYRDALEDCLEESERILSMLNTFMNLAEAESGAMRLRREQTDLAGIIRSIFELLE